MIHAKGTGLEKADKFLGVSIADEKEIIYIVAKTVDKNAIMKSIMDNAGNEQQGEIGCIFPSCDRHGRTCGCRRSSDRSGCRSRELRRRTGNCAEERKDQADRREAHGCFRKSSFV